MVNAAYRSSSHLKSNELNTSDIPHKVNVYQTNYYYEIKKKETKKNTYYQYRPKRRRHECPIKENKEFRLELTKPFLLHRFAAIQHFGYLSYNLVAPELKF
jgi:hypothetical protein